MHYLLYISSFVIFALLVSSNAKISLAQHIIRTGLQILSCLRAMQRISTHGHSRRVKSPFTLSGPFIACPCTNGVNGRPGPHSLSLYDPQRNINENIVKSNHATRLVAIKPLLLTLNGEKLPDLTLVNKM